MTSELVYIDGELFHADQLSIETLSHYGVAGMKWGKRKSGSAGQVSGRTARLEKNASRKAAALDKNRLLDSKSARQHREAKSTHANKKLELSKYRDKKKSVGLTKDDKKVIRSIRTDRKNVKATRLVITNNARTAILVGSTVHTLASKPAVRKHVAKYAGKTAKGVIRGAVKVASKSPNNFDGRVINESGRRVYRTAKNFGGNVRLVEPIALPAARKAIGR